MSVSETVYLGANVVVMTIDDDGGVSPRKVSGPTPESRLFHRDEHGHYVSGVLRLSEIRLRRRAATPRQ